LPRNIARHYSRLRRIFRELGAQGVLWYLIAKVYTKGASFTELKKGYELVRGSPVSKATLAVILRRMIKKGLVSKAEDGKYYPLVTKQEPTFSRIDRKRVKVTPSRRGMRADKKRESLLPERSIVREPYLARIAFRRHRR